MRLMTLQGVWQQQPQPELANKLRSMLCTLACILVPRHDHAENAAPMRKCNYTAAGTAGTASSCKASQGWSQ
jgi:hypothetical protein